uniref:Pentatricopeptide repeat (PPR) superfamily protein n=1 Tax=Cucumis melo TaxID=3656 RepID=A0A1S3BY92_CUCME
MAVAVASSLTFEGASCSTSYAFTSRWNRSSFDVCGRNKKFGSTEFHWLSKGRDLCSSKVSVAADYPDSVPDSSSYSTNKGYHPLEDLKVCKRARNTELTAAEVARTAVEVNSNALLLFPGTVHSEPHEQVSWDECQYVTDDYGDLYFEIFDSVNMLEDRGAHNPVNALIGMDMQMYESRRILGDYSAVDSGYGDVAPFDYDYIEAVEADLANIPVDWGVPDVSSLVHPVYFAKCLNKVVNVEYDRNMKHPSNGVAILGYLRPTYADEESYVRRLFNFEESEGYNTEWKGLEGETSNLEFKIDRSSQRSTLYRLEILRIELFSVYGVQSEVSLQDFQDAEPDILLHSTEQILERFNEKGIKCNIALKALCKKRGLHVEDAILIGVDSLGVDVRVCFGTEVRTFRFPFKIRATSEVAAEKQIQQLLFPRSRRKKLRSNGDGLRDTVSF